MINQNRFEIFPIPFPCPLFCNISHQYLKIEWQILKIQEMSPIDYPALGLETRKTEDMLESPMQSQLK